ncbi:acetolactate decarboxylase [Pedobacter sp. 22163]|uniref:acetolactate decarboxylase n=1 Tax=Pedobacter sp. 22163 TaxID=3453883 RepID=UPI003F82F79F
MDFCCKNLKKHVISHYNNANGLHNDQEHAHQIFQSSVMSALINGVYEGNITYGELSLHGDFGLGTFNDLDGEMVAIDGKFFQLRSNGSATEVDPSQKTPFAMVTYFKGEIQHEITSPMDSRQLKGLIDSLVLSKNLFYAIRIDGEFYCVETRTVSIQSAPFKPLTEVAKEEKIFGFSELRGTLAGFRSPDYSQGISVAGYHLHFIDDEQKRGGHVLDFKINRGIVRIDTFSSVYIALPETEAFENARLGADNGSAIKEAEG